MHACMCTDEELVQTFAMKELVPPSAVRKAIRSLREHTVKKGLCSRGRSDWRDGAHQCKFCHCWSIPIHWAKTTTSRCLSRRCNAEKEAREQKKKDRKKSAGELSAYLSSRVRVVSCQNCRCSIQSLPGVLTPSKHPVTELPMALSCIGHQQLNKACQRMVADLRHSTANRIFYTCHFCELKTHRCARCSCYLCGEAKDEPCKVCVKAGFTQRPSAHSRIARHCVICGDARQAYKKEWNLKRKESLLVEGGLHSADASCRVAKPILSTRDHLFEKLYIYYDNLSPFKQRAALRSIRFKLSWNERKHGSLAVLFKQFRRNERNKQTKKY